MERENLYSRISRNKRNSLLVVIGFTLFVLLLGWVFGEVSGWGFFGIILAAVISIIMAYSAYYKSDSIAVATAHAKPAEGPHYKALNDLVEGLAIAAGIPKPRIYVIPDESINAFAAGRDPEHAVVAVTEGSLVKLTKPELEGVLAHELSHVKNYDIRFMTTVIVMVGVVALLSDWIMWSFIFGGGRRNREGGGGWIMILGLVLAILSPIFAALVAMAASRKREFLADADGAMLSRNPSGLAGALKKIAGDSKKLEGASSATAPMYFSNPLKSKALFSSHPPIEERIKYLETLG
ncbi:zinc metalloprotease HtpX [Candidatus Micrarchaeota archaeon CG1_02_55_22]|nr:MAG: zinc metalloprotease HtpX [Candidatus Micrarchaeota archaeon CG1_02_55_22]